MPIRKADPSDHPALMAVWESAVRSSHFFLSERDIEAIRLEVAEYLPAFRGLWIYEGPRGNLDASPEGEATGRKGEVEKGDGKEKGKGDAEAAPEIVPQGFLGLAGQEGESLGRVQMLFVAPEFQRKGVGKALIGFAKERFSRLVLEANEGNQTGLQFYKTQGFSFVERLETDSQGRPFPLLRLCWEKEKEAKMEDLRK
jgi:putative acetyltransferase